MNHNLPLYNLFIKIKSIKGMDLEYSQYLDFLKIFSRKWNWEEEELAELCKILWLSKPQFKSKFEIVIQKYFIEQGKEGDSVDGNKPSGFELNKDIVENELDNIKKPDIEKKDKPKEDDLPETIDDSDDVDDETTNPKGKEEIKKEKKEETQNTQFTETLIYFDDIKNVGGQGNVESVLGETSALDTIFVFSAKKHSPVPPEKTAQAFKQLKYNLRKKPTRRFDARNMVRNIGQQNIINEIASEWKFKPDQNIILLQDHGGSMTPYESWGEDLKKALAFSGNVTTLKNYYFHKCPFRESKDKFAIYKEKGDRGRLLSSKVFKDMDNFSSVLFIYSHAGGLGYARDYDLLKDWMGFIEQSRPFFKKIIWFNPYINPKPEENRWKNTLAELLEKQILMLPLKREEINKALKRVR